MKVSLHAIKNNTLLGLKDIFSILSNCTDLSKSQFILYYYEYHLVNESQVIPDRLLDYLMTESDEGITLNYNEIILFSNFIFQSVDGKINILMGNTQN